MSAQDFASASDSEFDNSIDTTPVVDSDIEQSKLLKFLPETSCSEQLFAAIIHSISGTTVKCSISKGKVVFDLSCNISLVLSQKVIIAVANSSAPQVKEFVNFYASEVEEFFKPFQTKYDRTLMSFVIFFASNGKVNPNVPVSNVKNNLFALRNQNALVPLYKLYKEICKQIGIKEFIQISKPAAKTHKVKAPVKTPVETKTAQKCRNCNQEFSGDFNSHKTSCVAKKEHPPKRPCMKCKEVHFPYCKKEENVTPVES